MTYLLGEEMPEYSSWQQYFDYTVVGAAKPGFWMSDDPFTHLNTEGHPQERDTHKLEKGAVYLGNVDTFEKGIGYFGDKSSTLAIISTEIFSDRNERRNGERLSGRELETEMQQSDHHQEDLEQLHRLRQKRRTLDDLATCNEKHWA